MSGNNSYSVKEDALFVSQFFWIFRAPNAEELIEYVNNPGEPVDNDYYKFGGNCYFDCIPLSKNKYKELLKPSLQVLMDHWGVKKMNLTTTSSWICHYNKHNHQEVHHHSPDDLISVFFSNDGPDFAKFYFYDRMSVLNNNFWRSLLPKLAQRNSKWCSDIVCSDWIVPEVKAGDIIFFPGHIMHGVTPHQSDIVRKTLAVNFKAKTLK